MLNSLELLLIDVEVVCSVVTEAEVEQVPSSSAW